MSEPPAAASDGGDAARASGDDAARAGDASRSVGLPAVGFQVWGQAVAWETLMATARRVEALGFASLWANDHLSPATGPAWTSLGAPLGPAFEGWATLAGFAAATATIPLGMLVSSAGYRNIGLLVKHASALDHLAGGRLALGLGAGWHEPEHRAFGFGYPSLGERIDRLEEQAEAARRLLDGERVTLRGRWVTLDGAVNDPPPVARMPLMIGGSGERRTLRIVARFADTWNGEGDPATYARRSAVLDQHCAAVGRDPAAIRRTVGLPPASIRTTRAAAHEALVAVLARNGMSAADAAELAAGSPLVGSTAEVLDALAAYRDAGARDALIDLPGDPDRATLERLATALA